MISYMIPNSLEEKMVFSSLRLALAHKNFEVELYHDLAYGTSSYELLTKSLM